MLNLLLEKSRFSLVTELVAEYFSGTIAAGHAAHNQVLSSAVKELTMVQKWGKHPDWNWALGIEAEDLCRRAALH